MKLRILPLVVLAGAAMAGVAFMGTARAAFPQDPSEPNIKEIAARVSQSHAELYLEAVLKKDDRLVREHGAKSMRSDIESIGSLIVPYFGDRSDFTEVELDLIERFLYKAFYWTVNTEPRDSTRDVGLNPHGLGKILVKADSRSKTGTVLVERNGRSATIVTLKSASGFSYGKRASMIKTRFEEAQKNSNWWVRDRLYIDRMKGSYVIRSKDYTKDILVTASASEAKEKGMTEEAYAKQIRENIRSVMGRLNR